MAYCNQTDIENVLSSERLAQLAVDAVGGSLSDTAPQAVIDAAIERADARIDTALSPFYSTPLSTVPTFIQILSVDAAIAELNWRRPESYSELDRMFADNVKARLEALGRDGIVPGLTKTRGLPSYNNNLADDLKYARLNPNDSDDDPLEDF